MTPHDPNDSLGPILAAAGGRLGLETGYLPDEDPDAPFTIVAYWTPAGGTSTEIAVVHAASHPEAQSAICEALTRAGYEAVGVS